MKTQCFIEHLTCSTHSANDRRRGTGATWFSSCAENASSLLITGNHLYLILAQHLPKLPARIQEENQNHRKGFSSRQNLDVVQERKAASLASIPPHLYEQLRTLRGGKEGLHRVRVPGNKLIMKELHCIFSRTQIWLIMCCIDGFITETETVRHYSMMVNLQYMFLLVLLGVYTLYLLYKRLTDMINSCNMTCMDNTHGGHMSAGE